MGWHFIYTPLDGVYRMCDLNSNAVHIHRAHVRFSLRYFAVFTFNHQGSLRRKIFLFAQVVASSSSTDVRTRCICMCRSNKTVGPTLISCVLYANAYVTLENWLRWFNRAQIKLSTIWSDEKSVCAAHATFYILYDIKCTTHWVFCVFTFYTCTQKEWSAHQC